MDILYTRPMKECNFNTKENRNVDTIVQINNISEIDSYHTIGFLLSSQNNRFYNHIKMKSLKENSVDMNNYQTFGVVLFNAEFPNLEKIKKKFNDIIVISADTDLLYTFYPHKKIEELYKLGGKNYMTSNSIGIHWYGGFDKSGEFMNKVNHENYPNYKNTVIGKVICDIMKE